MYDQTHILIHEYLPNTKYSWVATAMQLHNQHLQQYIVSKIKGISIPECMRQGLRTIHTKVDEQSKVLLYQIWTGWRSQTGDLINNRPYHSYTAIEEIGNIVKV